MRGFFHFSISFLAAQMLLIASSGGAHALYSIDCSDMKLKYASGVPNGARHVYQLAGTCVVGGTYGQTYGRMFVTLSAVWDGKTNTLKENLKVEGEKGGKVSSVFRCSTDPYLIGVTCVMTAHTNTTKWPVLSPNPPIPFGHGLVNPKKAAELSSRSAGQQPPPPPPVPSKKQTFKPSAAASYRTGTDRPGADYMHFDLTMAKPDLCRQACARDRRCKAWTYVRPGFQGPRARCWLKRAVPSPVRNACCVSGVK